MGTAGSGVITPDTSLVRSKSNGGIPRLNGPVTWMGLASDYRSGHTGEALSASVLVTSLDKPTTGGETPRAT